MIVYHLTLVESIPTCLARGLLRSEGRRYVFSDWQDVRRMLEAMSLEARSVDEFTAHAVLVLRVDPEMLLPGPVPRAQLPLLLRSDGQRLQAVSQFIETDLDARRIVAIRDAWGNDVSRQFRPEKKGRGAVRRFLAFVRPYWYFVVLATVFGLGKFLLPLFYPLAVGWVVDILTAEPPLPPAERVQRVHHIVFMMIGVNLLWMICCYFRSLFTALAGHGMIRDLRVALFNHVQRLSHQFFAQNQTGSIVSRVVNDIAQAQNFVGSALTNVWMDGSLLFVLLAWLFSIHVKLTLVTLTLMPIFLVSIRLVGSRIRLTSREVQQRVETLSGGLQEKVSGVGIVKSFTREDQELEAFETQANKLYSKVLHSVRLVATNEMIVGFVVLTSPLLVLWYGSTQVAEGALTVGALTSFLLLVGYFYSPLQRLSDLSVVLSSAIASIERIFEYFDIQPHVLERENATLLDKVAGRIEFEDVSFGYESENEVLHGIDLDIKPGETVAFVGPSGSGKSTLANLIPRFYDPTRGVIRLDGHDLRELALESLRRHIGIVNQDTILFSGTIRENLLLANPAAGADDLLEALRAANALDFVEELPEGLWTEIGERGVKLSGGQRQRLAIARAFLKDPEILILDEATSALDSKSEHHIQEALARLLVGRTSIVIAHRLSTILGADKIATIDYGRIVEVGTHEQLLEQGGLYAQLYEEQFRQVVASS